jgi:hypothetical protein
VGVSLGDAVGDADGDAVGDADGDGVDEGVGVAVGGGAATTALVVRQSAGVSQVPPEPVGASVFTSSRSPRLGSSTRTW